MVASSDLLGQNFKAVSDGKYGTRFYQADLHFHTPASGDARGKNRYGFNPYKMQYLPDPVDIINDPMNVLQNFNAMPADMQTIKDLRAFGGLEKFEVDYPTAVRNDQYKILLYARLVATRIVRQICEQKLDLVAITDHNGMGTIWNDGAYMDLAAPTWYELIDDAAERVNKAAGKTRVRILPGVEISTNAMHILAVFKPQDPRRKVYFMICDLLNRLGFRSEQWGDKDQVGTTGTDDTINLISQMGGLAIPAHVDADDQALFKLYKLKSGALKNVLENENLRAMEVVNPGSLRARIDGRDESDEGDENVGPSLSSAGKASVSLKAHLDRIRNDKGLPSLAYFQGSDAHDLKKIGARKTHLKMTEPSFEGLETAIQMPGSRVRIEDSKENWKGLYLRGLAFDVPFLGAQTVRFNRNLNCISGKKGAGKTTLYNLMQFLVGAPYPNEKNFNGNATLFVEYFDSDQKVSNYAYCRDNEQEKPGVFSIQVGDDGKTLAGSNLVDPNSTSLLSKLKPTFYDPDITTQEQLKAFLLKILGNPGSIGEKEKEKFNDLFFTPRFLDGEKLTRAALEKKKQDLQGKIDKPGATDDVKQKASTQQKIVVDELERRKSGKDHLLMLDLSTSPGSFKLKMNLRWRTDANPQFVEFSRLNRSQRKIAVLCLLISSDQFGPIIIDAPEEEFNNDDMVKYLVPLIVEFKDVRQIFLFTNNPILAVNTDPDNYLLLQQSQDEKLEGILSGFAIDAKTEEKTDLLNILEGSLSAFRRRARRYG